MKTNIKGSWFERSSIIILNIIVILTSLLIIFGYSLDPKIDVMLSTIKIGLAIVYIIIAIQWE